MGRHDRRTPGVDMAVAAVSVAGVRAIAGRVLTLDMTTAGWLRIRMGGCQC